MIYQLNRNYIINNTMEQLLLFVTGGAGVGRSFIIRTVQVMLIRMERQNPILLTAPTGFTQRFLYQFNIIKLLIIFH